MSMVAFNVGLQLGKRIARNNSRRSLLIEIGRWNAHLKNNLNGSIDDLKAVAKVQELIETLLTWSKADMVAEIVESKKGKKIPSEEGTGKKLSSSFY